MTQKTRKWRLVLTGITMLVVMLFGMALSAHAARDIPSKVRGYPGSVNSFEVKLEKGEYIKITSAKKLKYKLTHENWSTENYESNDDSEATISYYTKKKGDYTVTFDIFSAATDAKVGSGSVKVYVRDDSPFKKILMNGKDYYTQSNMLTAKTMKFKVVMNKGYKFKKMEVGTYGAPKEESNNSSYSSYVRKDNDVEYKTVKNGSKITLGTRGYYYLYDYSRKASTYEEAYKSHSLSDSMTAPTYIRVSYIDKWTKKLETTSWYFSRIL